jgi:peroxiredoxin
MVKTPSTMAALGTDAPDFSLPDPKSGSAVSLGDFADAPALLVAFLSNHCPFVMHLADALGDFSREYASRGLAIVGICSNDVENYPADSPEKMAEEVDLRGYAFPYLHDASQDVAKAFEAACTPDFFLYDAEGKLVYRGQFDDSRPSVDAPITGADLRAACDAVLAGQLPSPQQRPSVGCNIKWMAGNDPPWFG